MTAKKVVLIVLGLIVLLALIQVVSLIWTDAGEAAVKTRPAQFQRTTTIIDDTEIGSITQYPPEALAGSAYEKAGCGTAHAEGYVNSIGLRAVNTDMWQRFCWAHGHITDVDPVKRQVDITAWGEAINWHNDGWRDGPDGWTNYGGKYHGGHYANKVVKLHGCVAVAIPGVGCITVKSIALRHSLLEHAGGFWWSDVSVV